MYGKILIQCDLEVMTGMHIGASSVFSAIGAVDSPVVRDPLTSLPIVPGSSLKGKIRSLLARSLNNKEDTEKEKKDNKDLDFDKDDERILRLFGSAKPQRARLQFADCFLKNKEQMDKVGITEVKTENAIQRSNSVANPRQIERVTKGAVFGVNLVYDVVDADQMEEDFKLLAKGIKLLQWDYLGGHGSRGSGRVSLKNFSLKGFETNADLKKLTDILKKVEKNELFAV